MSEAPQRSYRFLDTETDRQELVDDIRRARQAVLKIAQSVPEAQWYEPRYHTWSLAAMLGHLHMLDRLSMFQIQMAMLGINVPISQGMLNAFNDMMSKIFRQRVLQTTIKSIERNEANITRFILAVPIQRFTKTLYDPAIAANITVEQSIQEYFLFHWQGHLQDMREVEATARSNE